MTRGRWLAVAVVAAALLFALLGGEYSVADLRELRRQVAAESTLIGRLGQEVDSLGEALEAIQTDPVVQERVARERHGMMRPGEYTFRIIREPAESRP